MEDFVLNTSYLIYKIIGQDHKNSNEKMLKSSHVHVRQLASEWETFFTCALSRPSGVSLLVFQKSRAEADLLWFPGSGVSRVSVSAFGLKGSTNCRVWHISCVVGGQHGGLWGGHLSRHRVYEEVGGWGGAGLLLCWSFVSIGAARAWFKTLFKRIHNRWSAIVTGCVCHSYVERTTAKVLLVASSLNKGDH